ncbi:hypothetical protein LK996_07225 [Lysobacter sp. A6]|uniref:Uncharacterized protein n=1 Tax=Noviluteimonas lactosilytica TaxID=2888523 RepID=A0ABS8JH27_9GAMM|nr:hypothetical protein [Lysobacter lactosilyticus]MCC8362867.1 hypothetical protein [Lysobacter lactosilyticus]
MPAWPPVIDGGKRFDLSHLDPFIIEFELDGLPVRLHVAFGAHVFSNERAHGVRVGLLRDERYFCPRRYATSFDAARYMHEGFIDGHVRAFLGRNGQQFYTLDAEHIAIFMTIRKTSHDEREIHCHVVSAYDPTWSRNRLPRGKLYAVRTVIRRRINGDAIPIR